MIRKFLYLATAFVLFTSCTNDVFIGFNDVETELATRKNDKKDKKPKKTLVTDLSVKADESSSNTRAYDGNLVWHWEYGDALTGYQVAYDNIRNRLAYDPSANMFSCPDFTYQSSSKELFHFIYPSGAEYEKGKLKAVQDGVWRPVAVFTTPEKVKIDELPSLQFEQLSSALELRVWSKDNTAKQESVVSAVLTSDSDFVACWTLNEDDMSYTQTLDGKQIVIEDINESVFQVNMPDLPEGYSSDVKIKLVLTRADGKTCTTYLPQELTYVKQKRTVYNLIFTPDPTFTCATYNVDGLPEKVLSIFTLNEDGPGSNGTKQISQKIATSGWDFVTFQENFSYNSELQSTMKSYYMFGTHRKFSLLSALGTADTDGLGFATLAATCSFSGETWKAFNNAYGGLTDGANTSLKKGFRYYLVTMKDGVEFDVYVTHMNSGSDSGHINARASQFQQLANYINEHRSDRPIIIMGDFNARYTRDDYQTNFWNVLDADLYANLKDAWTELIWDGYYPEYPSDSWVVTDKYDPNNGVGDIKYGVQDGEVVDKILYINDPNSSVRIFAKSYKRDMDYRDLADHTPVVVEFGYEKK